MFQQRFELNFKILMIIRGLAVTSCTQRWRFYLISLQNYDNSKRKRKQNYVILNSLWDYSTTITENWWLNPQSLKIVYKGRIICLYEQFWNFISKTALKLWNINNKLMVRSYQNLNLSTSSFILRYYIM